MKKNLTIALLGSSFGWCGGADFLRHIANGLLSRQEEYQLKICLLLPVANKYSTPLDGLRFLRRSLKGSIERKKPWLALPHPVFHESLPDYFKNIHGEGVDIFYHDSSKTGLLRCLDQISADVVLPVNGSLGENYPVPWVAYIPDFQHKYLPKNFSVHECFDRDIHFAKTFKDAKVAIVNSKQVKDDIFSFFPYAETKIFNLPFCPNPISEWFNDLPFNVKDLYCLPEQFFLISNQFWIHKDHLTAFRAMLSLDTKIVCTGTMSDYRNPNYMNEIQGFLDQNNLGDRVRLLGHIPKRHQIEIMKKCVAVVQPTLFEGGPGGGCVFDAVSLGVPVIVSDIPVNKEIQADNILFFKAGDSEDLAGKMKKMLLCSPLSVDREVLVKRGHANLVNLGERLLEALDCAF